MKTYDSSQAPRFAQLLAQREQDLCALLRARDALGDARQEAVTDFKDLAAEESAGIVDEAQAEQAAQELEQVLAAQARLRDGKYGSCLQCGEPIDLRRLELLPATPNCTGCQATHEPARGAGRWH